MNLFSCSQALKYPLYESTRGALGEWMMEGVELRSNKTLCDKVSSIARISFNLIGMVFSTPLWMVGESLEVCTQKGRELFNDEVNLIDQDLDSLTLDPEKTQYMGTSVSTFQATSDPNFCKGSVIHDALKDPSLELGQGVDVITPQGRNQIADRLEQMGANAFRFSVEWPDVKINGLNRYIETARYFHDRHFKLIITLDHWLGDGSIDVFEKEGDEAAFVSYAESIYLALRPYVSVFLTFNEPNVDANQKYVMGDLPPKKIARFWSSMQLVALKLKAHRAVHQRLHELEKTYKGAKNGDPLQVGLSHQAICMVPRSRINLIARITAFVITHTFHESFMRLAEKPEMKETLDVLGAQYYTRPMAARNGWQIVDSVAVPTKQFPEAWMVEGMRYRFDPQGILPVLESIHARLGKQIIVTETGTAGEINPYVISDLSFSNAYYDANSNPCLAPPAQILDEQIINNSKKMEGRKAIYYKYSLQAIREAQDRGVQVSGVFPWTLFDNIEWQHGYDPGCAFGILARDRKSGIIRITEGFETIRQVFTQTRLQQKTIKKVA